eukprot:gb/GECG01013130.1/.p1 GENE.gb/GECG01013130.1/~~gb/GECG01013130.1/.p1  ORF type:complete len:310 (+),score=45.54 gb/GECG01013130.1/:1-930(+)
MKKDNRDPRSIDDGGQKVPASQEPSHGSHGSGNSKPQDVRSGMTSGGRTSWGSYLWYQTKVYVPKGVDAVKSYSKRVVAPGLQSLYRQSYNKFKEKVNDPAFRDNIKEKAETGAQKSSEAWKKYTPILRKQLSSNSQRLASQAGYGISRVASSEMLTGWLRRTRNFTLLLVFGGMFMYGLGKSLPDVLATQYSKSKKRNGESEEPDHSPGESNSDRRQSSVNTSARLLDNLWPSYEKKAGKDQSGSADNRTPSSWPKWVLGKSDSTDNRSEEISKDKSWWWPFSLSQESSNENASAESSKSWTDWIRGK